MNMTRLCCAAMVVVCASHVAAGAQNPAGEAEIRALVAAQEAAWNAGDAAAYSKDVSADVAFTNIFGMVM